MAKEKLTMALALMLALLLSPSVGAAGDFEWMDDLNIKAKAGPDGFRARLSTRFRIGNADVEVVVGKVERPADAYMVLRLAEMSSKPVGFILERYRSEKGGGWGALAKSLGIKPGSREFHALKNGSDLYRETAMSKNGRKKKGRGR